ncbi:MAG: hypothetical protein WA899_19560 [Candidatus Sulfotelmatobacter sp.]
MTRSFWAYSIVLLDMVGRWEDCAVQTLDEKAGHMQPVVWAPHSCLFISNVDPSLEHGIEIPDAIETKPRQNSADRGVIESCRESDAQSGPRQQSAL